MPNLYAYSRPSCFNSKTVKYCTEHNLTQTSEETQIKDTIRLIRLQHSRATTSVVAPDLDEGLSVETASVDIRRPTHTFIGGGSFHVPYSEKNVYRTCFDNAVVCDVHADLKNGFVATQGVGQLSINEVGHASAFPAFFDIDLEFVLEDTPSVASSMLTGANQLIIARITLIIQHVMRRCFAGVSDKRWKDEVGVMFVSQTLPRRIGALNANGVVVYLGRDDSDDEDGEEGEEEEMRRRKDGSDGRARSRKRPASHRNQPTAAATSSLSLDAYMAATASSSSSSMSYPSASDDDETWRSKSMGVMPRKRRTMFCDATSSSFTSPVDLDDDRACDGFQTRYQQQQQQQQQQQSNGNSNSSGAEESSMERAISIASGLTNPLISLTSLSNDGVPSFSSSVVNKQQQQQQQQRSNVLAELQRIEAAGGGVDLRCSSSNGGSSRNLNPDGEVPRIEMRQLKCTTATSTLESSAIAQLRSCGKSIGVYKVGVHVNFSDCIISSSQAREIHPHVTAALVNNIAMDSLVCDATTLIAYHSKKTRVSVSELDYASLYATWSRIVDRKVWTPSPHCRRVFTHKAGKCSGGQVNGSSSNNRGSSNVAFMGPLYSRSNCGICRGTGVASDGPGAVACPVYILDGDGNDSHWTATPPSASNEGIRTHVVSSPPPPPPPPPPSSSSSSSSLHPPASSASDPHHRRPYALSFLRQRTNELPAITLFFNEPLHLKAGEMARTINPNAWPIPLRRIPVLNEQSTVRYIQWVLNKTSIRLEFPAHTMSEEGWAQIRTDGYTLSPLSTAISSPSLSSARGPPLGGGGGFTDLPTNHVSMTNTSSSASKSTAMLLSPMGGDGSGGSSPAAGTVVAMTSIKRLKIVSDPQVDARLKAYIHSLRPEWSESNIRFASTRVITKTLPLNVLLSSSSPQPTRSSVEQIVLTKYDGPSLLVLASNGDGARYCSIVGRRHKTSTVYFRVTPTHVIQLCASVSNDRPAGTPACRYSCGPIMWQLPQQLSELLFNAKTKKVSQMLELVRHSEKAKASLSFLSPSSSSPSSMQSTAAGAMSSQRSTDAMLQRLEMNAVMSMVGAQAPSSSSSVLQPSSTTSVVDSGVNVADMLAHDAVTASIEAMRAVMSIFPE
ncbi:MAG: hypothetical protein WC763_05530 [Candidatus Paceibacterota bacterium]